MCVKSRLFVDLRTPLVKGLPKNKNQLARSCHRVSKRPKLIPAVFFFMFLDPPLLQTSSDGKRTTHTIQRNEKQVKQVILKNEFHGLAVRCFSD